MRLPEPLTTLLKPLFDVLPLDQAMPELVPSAKADEVSISAVESIVKDPLIVEKPALAAGLWLYVDELDRSHSISQAIPGPLGAAWHGIMHRREGDFWNSKYWFRQAGSLAHLGGGNAPAFVDQVEQTFRNNLPDLLAYQRKEWALLFEWSATEGSK